MLQKLAGIYLILVSVAVGGYFILNPLHAETYDPEQVWQYLDVLMVIAALLALTFNTRRKFAVGGVAQGEPPSRRYLETNILFYATIGVSILLLHSWVSFLALGLEVGDHQGFVKWAVVDTLLPLTFGATGFAMWRE